MKKVNIRKFNVEYKHRPASDCTGEHEQLIITKEIHVPKLADSNLETQWVALQVWGYLESEEAKELNINQAFIFNADFSEILLRMETQVFYDENPKHIPAPSQFKYDVWREKVDKRMKRLYSLSLDEWNGGLRKGFVVVR